MVFWASIVRMSNNLEFDAGTDREGTGAQRFDVQMVARFSDHNCTVWRTAWNVTGTMLASTGDDGYVRMWKSK